MIDVGDTTTNMPAGAVEACDTVGCKLCVDVVYECIQIKTSLSCFVCFA
jgi:hypothetical protein